MFNNIFNIDPGTLLPSHDSTAWLCDLYKKYTDDLATVCKEMASVRKRMLESGCSADFSDRESEALYLLIREMKPDVVVEISPCFGYSTNYILAALTANGKGHLQSYEIMESFKGRKITDIIHGNLSHLYDKSRLTLHIGDAMKADIPECDFLFMDSCHEAYFPAWYFPGLVDKTKLMFIHDVLIFDKKFKTVVPKAAFLGVKEQCYVLESLALNNQKLFSISEFEHIMPEDLKKSLTARSGGAPDRSVVIKGHKQAETAQKMHDTQPLIEELKKLILIGDRDEVFRQINNIIAGDFPVFTKLEAIALLPQLGYRYPFYYKLIPEIKVEYDRITLPEYVLLFEIALSSCNLDMLRSIARRRSCVRINRKAFSYLTDGYLRMANIGLVRRIKNLKPRLAKYAKYFPSMCEKL
jgi:predicted O-methyltransferase YrrM